MFKHKFTTNWEGNGDTLTGTAEISADSEIGFEVEVPASTTLAVAAAFPVANLKSAYLLARGAVTIKTNSASAPDDTLALAAGVPLAWISGESALFSENVTSLHLVNPNTAPVVVSIRLLVDSTV